MLHSPQRSLAGPLLHVIKVDPTTSCTSARRSAHSCPHPVRKQRRPEFLQRIRKEVGAHLVPVPAVLKLVAINLEWFAPARLHRFAGLINRPWPRNAQLFLWPLRVQFGQFAQTFFKANGSPFLVRQLVQNSSQSARQSSPHRVSQRTPLTAARKS